MAQRGLLGRCFSEGSDPAIFLFGAARLKNDKTKKVNGTDLSSRCFLWAPDTENTDSWCLPVFDPTSAAKTQNLLKNHLARFSEMKSIPPAERPKLWERLIGACIAHGIDVSKHTEPVKAAESPTVQVEPPKPAEPVILKIKKDPEIERLIALADRRADEMLRAMGLE